MLRICISGLSCSGKTIVGETLARELNILHVTKNITDTYKRVESAIMEGKDPRLNVIQTIDKRYADDFDKEVMELANKTDCVITTWLGPWIIKDATVRVWLSASADERARRRAEKEGIGIEEAKDCIKEKDEMSVNSFKDVYGINVKDHAFFDMMVNTERLSIEEAVSLISMLAIGKSEGRFR